MRYVVSDGEVPGYTELSSKIKGGSEFALRWDREHGADKAKKRFFDRAGPFWIRSCAQGFEML